MCFNVLMDYCAVRCREFAGPPKAFYAFKPLRQRMKKCRPGLNAQQEVCIECLYSLPLLRQFAAK
jgi:hypothetical protein